MIIKHGKITIEGDNIFIDGMHFDEINSMQELLADIKEHINGLIDDAIEEFDSKPRLVLPKDESLHWEFDNGELVKKPH